MTSKVKTNILYIASDNSSDEEPENKTPQIQKAKSQDKKNQFNLVGSHRLNNSNKLSKGFFNTHANQQDYQHQKIAQNSVLKQKIQITKREIKTNKSVSFSGQQKVQLQKNTQDSPQTSKTTNFINQDKQQVKQQQPKKQVYKNQEGKTSKMKISKKILFQFKQEQSSQQSQQSEDNRQRQAQKQQAIKNIQKAIDQKDIKQQCVNVMQKNVSKNNSQTEVISLTPLDLQAKIDKKQFLLCQIPHNKVLECKIMKRNQLTNFLLSQFDMTFRNFCAVHLASCKKYIANLTSNYRISVEDNKFSYNHQNIIGKVRELGDKQNLYNVYSNGKNPKQAMSNNINREQVRQILATVRIKCGKGPRQIEVYVLNYGQSYHRLLGTSLQKQINLQSLYSIQQNRQKIKLIKSRKPVWVASRGQYFLDFGGRVNQASIRNFILQDPQTGKQILVFGKNQNNIYNLDISHPLTPNLGLALVIPQLDKDL